jgi:glycosyltransferase involved in cell wall biosynthesis
MQFSAIIPTHSRQASLSRTLACLADQHDRPDGFEVIVVDDGSTDETWPWLQANLAAYPFAVRAVRLCGRGPAAARNRGLEVAQGELVLFLGDDIYASPGLLARHLAWHVAYPGRWTAVVGQVQWAPDLPVTSLMRWMERGAQWRFEGLEPGELLDYTWFITANLSLQRSVLLESGGFDEGFRDAAMEDTELGYRLSRQGLQIRYAPDALAYHWHPISLDAFLDRERKLGQAAVCLSQRWPELQAQLLDPATNLAGRPSILRWLGSRLVHWPWLAAALLPSTRWLAHRPPGALQAWVGPLFWLAAFHNRLLGSDSV